MDILKEAVRVLEHEYNAIKTLADNLDSSFTAVAEAIHNRKGKVIIAGIGKSGIIGKKIASTFSSTGTPAFFLHPTEGTHGDLGIVEKKDVIILISNSGNNEELLAIIDPLKRQSCVLILLTSNPESRVALLSDYVIDTHAKEEACPMNLAPTTSATVTMAVGDALAIILLNLKGFNHKEYALYHPGGTIGKKLLIRVKDLMHTGKENPIISEDISLDKALKIITEKGLGMVTITNKKNELQGILTDGDIRRILVEGLPDLEAPVKKYMKIGASTIQPKNLASKALSIMEEMKITSLVVTEKNIPVAVIHLHDLLKAGLA